jgi:hypothetical protein
VRIFRDVIIQGLPKSICRFQSVCHLNGTIQPVIEPMTGKIIIAQIAQQVETAQLERRKSTWISQGWATFFSLIVVLVVLGIIRRHGIFWPTLYFEDGQTFYKDQLLRPSATLLLEPYALGYALLILRIAALLAWCIGPLLAPYALNGVGLIVGSASCALFSLSRFRALLCSDLSRVILCVLFALSLDNTEVLVSASNCFWTLGLPVFLLIFLPPSLSKWLAHTFGTCASFLLAYASLCL